MKKKAFTLAEVLITLGIIGIVAAITLPTLIQRNQKQVAATRLKQTYAQLFQAINMAQADYGDMKNWGVENDYVNDANVKNQNAAKFAQKFIEPYVKYAAKPSILFLKDKGYGPYLSKDGRVFLPIEYKCYLMELANGVTLFFSYSLIEENFETLIMPWIYVDINGKTKPNILGQDFYLFSLDATKAMRLRPYGYGRDRDYLMNACKRDSGQDSNRNLMCTALIMLDGWEIKKDYPW